MVQPEFDQQTQTESSSKGVFAAKEDTLVCVITGDQKKASAQEQTLQSVAQSLASEYGFDAKNMARDFSLAYLDPETGNKKRLRHTRPDPVR